MLVIKAYEAKSSLQPPTEIEPGTSCVPVTGPPGALLFDRDQRLH